MMDPHQFKTFVIRPVLIELSADAGLSLASPEAETLLLGTALQESALTYIRQLGDGTGWGGHGLYQEEPEDFHDLIANFLSGRPRLLEAFERWRSKQDAIEQLTMDPAFGTVVARLHYYRAPDPLPADVAGMAAYYKVHYNSALGAAQPGQVKANFERAFAIT